MKRLIVVLLVGLMCFFVCGFKKKAKPIIILSSNQITQENAATVENTFGAKTRIYYVLYSPNGFKYPGVRMQISKQDDKTSNWGFKIIESRDISLDMAQNTYRNYLYIQMPGHYIIQFFYLNNKDYPFAHREFRVQ